MPITDSSKPLLTPTVDALNTPSSSMPSRTSSPTSVSFTRKPSLWPLLSLLILVHLSTALYTLPLNRVIERRLCQEHYARLDPHSFPPDDIIPEKVCKVDAVQRQLAWLQGIMETTLVVCGKWTLVCSHLYSTNLFHPRLYCNYPFQFCCRKMGCQGCALVQFDPEGVHECLGDYHWCVTQPHTVNMNF